MAPTSSDLTTSQINTSRSREYVQLDRALIELLTKQDYSEFELIRTLQKPPYSIFPKDALVEPLTMFQTHFVLFNSLYRIKRYLQKDLEATLNITTLKISWQKIGASEQTLTTLEDRIADQKLASYYLDWNNFESTDKRDVEDLLNSFWESYLSLPTRSEGFTDALLTLQLDPNTSVEQLTRKQVKSAYKTLSLKFHPDKGGEKARFQEITAAYHAIMLHL